MPSTIRLPVFDWEKLIADPNTRHALQDFAAQVNTKLGDLQNQIDIIEDTDTGVPPHNLLQSDIHLDTVTDAPSPGSVIVGQPADEVDLSLFWFDGEPINFLISELQTGGVAYWFDGLPFWSISSLTGGDVKWVEFLIGPSTYVLTSRGNRVEWAEVTGLVNRVSASVYLTADLSMTSGVANTLSWGVAEFDSGPFWSSVAPTVLTVPADQAGLYFVLCQIASQLNALSSMKLTILLNGTSIAATEFGNLDGNCAPKFQVARLVPMAVGDEISITVTPFAANTILQGVDDTFLQLVRVN